MCIQPRFCLQQPLSPIHKVLFLVSKSIQGKRDPNRKFLHVTLVIARSCQDCRNQPGAALPSQIGIQERTPPTAPYCRCSGLLPWHSRTCAHCSGAHATAEHQDYSMLHWPMVKRGIPGGIPELQREWERHRVFRNSCKKWRNG